MSLGREKLIKYLQDNEIAQADFARGAGLTRQQINHLVTGFRRATLQTAIAIEKATKGVVWMSDWLEPGKEIA